jgi:RpiR family transcriptional regulator, carbohydrate utilization regulator
MKSYIVNENNINENIKEVNCTDTSTPIMIINIKAKIPSLNPAQKKLSEYIVNHFTELEGMQSKVLAKKCCVSEPTVTRFVKEIGYENYRHFQIDIAKTNVNVNENISKSGYSDISTDDCEESICKKVINYNVQALLDTLKIIDINKMRQAAELVIKAKTIHIFSQGRSSVTANSIEHRLLRLGMNCVVYSDPHEIAIISSLAAKDDLIIGISTFGRSITVVKGMERAHNKGSKVIGLTSYKDVPLEDHADIILYAVDNEPTSFGFEPSSATISQIALLDCLYMTITLNMKEEAKRCFQDTYEALIEQRL